MKMYKLFSVIVILVLLIVATPAQAATLLTVDASTGTVGYGDVCPSPTNSAVYKSLQAAIDCAVNGDTIEVNDGTYGVTGQVNQDGYSTAILIGNLDDLTIRAAPGHNPVVKPATTGNIVSISIEGSERLTIDNIDSDQTVAQFDNWHVFDADGLTVRNSHFEGGEDGIDFNNDLTTALIENNEFVNIDTGSGDEVLDFTDASYSDILIQDNYFKHNYRQITIFPPSGESATDFTIRRNIMDGTNSQEAVRFIGPDDVTLENNVIMNSAQQGVYIDSGSSNITIWHNTFFNNGYEELRTKVNSADIRILNNIFYANGTSAALAASISPLPGEDYNLIYNEGSATESGSQPAVTSFGANTVTGMDPQFVSTTAGSEDLHPQAGSPAVEAGVDLGVSDDIEKNPRPNPTGTDPDMGAFEVSFNASPVCATAYPSFETIWPPNHQFVPVDVLGVTDPDGDPVTITIDSIFQDEPVDTFGDGSFTPDGQGIGSNTAIVRAERAGTKDVPGNGRVYHISFTAEDGNGGSCVGEVLVGVPHDQGKGKNPVDDGALYDSTVP